MRIVFMGTPQAAVPSLERLMQAGHDVAAVYTQPDRPSGRGQHTAISAVKQFSVDHDLRVVQPSKLRTQEASDELRALSADVAVVVAYGRILPESFLTAFPKGAINLHFSLLPKYRGAAPVNWAIVNGETTTGVTTMKMDAGLDTGDILSQRSTIISAEENAVQLMDRLSTLGADVLVETIGSIDSIVPRPQSHDAATLAPIMRKEEGRIDWQMSADEIAARVRGFQPFPTAFTSFRDLRFTIWGAGESVRVTDDTLPPGSIAEATGDRLDIVCGHGTRLQVSEAQLEGKRRMAARDIINGSHPTVGEILGK